MSPRCRFKKKKVLWCSMPLLQWGMIVKLGEIIKYKWGVDYLSKHNKNIMQSGILYLKVWVRFPHEGLSEEKFSRVVCLSSELLNDSLPAAGQTEPFNLCSAGTDCSTPPAKCCTPNAAVTLTGADLCNYNPYFLMYWCSFPFLLIPRCRVKSNRVHSLFQSQTPLLSIALN